MFHRVGLDLVGSIERLGADDSAPGGISWIDTLTSGSLEGRLSRGFGLPVPVPDLWGLSLRPALGDDSLRDPASKGSSGNELRLVTVLGRGVVGRTVPLVRLSPWGVPFGTVRPVRWDASRVYVGAVTVSGAPASATTTGQARELTRRPWVLRLARATRRGAWTDVATLSLSVR